MDPLIITVAGVGAELTRERQPNLPVSAAEIALDAEQCREAGASIYHLHVRDRDGKPTMAVEAFAAARDAIRERTDLVVQFTSGGAAGDDEEARIAPLQLRPEMASLTTGTVNFGNAVFSNPTALVTRFYKRMRELGVLPEFEIFEAGMIAAASRIYDVYGDGHHQHYDFVLGVPGAMPGWPDAIPFLVSHLPSEATWSATGIGKTHLPVANQAIELGGHVRTGFEDVLYYAPGKVAASNRQLIERVVDISRRRDREVATPSQARQILQIQ